MVDQQPAPKKPRKRTEAAPAPSSPAPVPTKQTEAPAAGSIEVHVAIRKNEGVPMKMESGRAVKANPGGWRIGLWSRVGTGMNYYEYTGPKEDTETSELLAVRAYAILKAMEFGHDKDVTAKTILVKGDFPDVFKTQNNSNHVSAKYAWVARKKLNEDWGRVELNFQTVDREQNQATEVAKQTNLPNYYTAESKAALAAKRSVTPQAPQATIQRPAAPTSAAQLFHAGMSSEQLRQIEADLEDALAMCRAMISARERRDQQTP
jgi:hypothetical protein